MKSLAGSGNVMKSLELGTWVWASDCSRNSKEASVARAEGIQERSQRGNRGPISGLTGHEGLTFIFEGDGSLNEQ